MKTAAFATLLALAASPALAQYDNQSEPFSLVLHSDDAALDGTGLYACHSGAAIEQLCTGGTPGSASGTFYFNTSSTPNPDEPYPSGWLVWNLPYNGDQVESEPLNFFYTPNSNVATLLFEPAYSGQAVAFDADDQLFLTSYYDDSTFDPVNPPDTTQTYTYYNWHVCRTYYTGYYYQALTWVTVGEPSNPTCSPVNVTREFL